MKRSLLLVFAATIVLFSNTFAAKFKQDTRQVSNFNGVLSSGNINVIIKLGNTESLRLEGDADAIADLITEVKNGMLNIRPKTKIFWDNNYNNRKVTAYITAKHINNLTMSGSGTMLVEGKMTENKLVATLSGSGKITGNVDVQSFVGVISGSGSLVFNGVADEAVVTVSGSGRFSGNNLRIEDLASQLSGSGSVNVNVNRTLKATISGSGSLVYSGNPQIDQTTVGSGRVRRFKA